MRRFYRVFIFGGNLIIRKSFTDVSLRNLCISELTFHALLCNILPIIFAMFARYRQILIHWRINYQLPDTGCRFLLAREPGTIRTRRTFTHCLFNCKKCRVAKFRFRILRLESADTFLFKSRKFFCLFFHQCVNFFFAKLKTFCKI